MPAPERLSRYSHVDRRSLHAEPPAPQPRKGDLVEDPYAHLPEEALHPDLRPLYSEVGMAEAPESPLAQSQPVPRPEPAIEAPQADELRAEPIKPSIEPQPKTEPKPARRFLRRKPEPQPVIAAETVSAEKGGTTARRVAEIGAKAASLLSSGARIVRRKLRRSELKKSYTQGLILLHRRVFDRKLERLFFRPTASPLPSGAEQPAAPLSDGPVPQRVFDWAMTALPADLKNFVFVDFRAQRGRAMMLAARRNFEKIIGYEFDEAVFDDLQMNVAQFPRSLMTCRNIECLRGDRDGLAIPNQPAVLYFSNAFRERFLSLIMSHAATSYRLNPRRLYVILENAPAGLTTGQDDIFYRITPTWREKLALRFFSPIRVEIYRSLV